MVLARNGGQPMDPETLVSKAWGDRILRPRALISTVHRLRRKIEIDPKKPAVLVGVRGGGYRLCAELQRPFSSIQVLSDTLWLATHHAGHFLGLNDCVLYLRDGNVLVQMAAHGPKN